MDQLLHHPKLLHIKIIKLNKGDGDSKAETGKRLEEIRIEIADLDLIKDKKELKPKKEEREALVQKYRTEEDLEEKIKRCSSKRKSC